MASLVDSMLNVRVPVPATLPPDINPLSTARFQLNGIAQ